MKQTHLYRIVSRQDWESAHGAEQYTPPELAAGGFVHLCDASQVPFVANRHFQGQSDLLVLEIDTARIPCEIRYEHSEPDQPPFPHAYGPIPMQAIVGILPLENDQPINE